MPRASRPSSQDVADRVLDAAAAARRQPHRRRRQLRRRRAAGRAVAARATGTSSSWPPRPASAPPTRRYEQLQRSLERLGVDRVDLWQLHNLADPIEWDIALSPGGAIEAAVAGQGRRAWSGSSASPATAPRSPPPTAAAWSGIDFDSVLLPYNYVTMQSPLLRRELRRRCRRPAPSAASPCRPSSRPPAGPGCGREHTARDLVRAVPGPGRHRPVAVVVARPRRRARDQPGRRRLLPKVLDAASRFEDVPTDEAMRALNERADAAPLFV